ncbi:MULTISPECIES: hypothetical protein [unclassified Campylobacter]|uniref:hypothetical protein n=1 Tax=unclassified Campylobacter TaxID=2593542 RepID=UPI001680721E|nr:MULTISPECIES: hypothetical protein [unclassified Campylobacter]
MSLITFAVDTFYNTKNTAVFKAQDTQKVQRDASEFSTRQASAKVKFINDGEEVSLNLNQESLRILKDNFNTSDFLSLKDRSTALSGSAVAFVEG